jgi:hypothetical protein
MPLGEELEQSLCKRVDLWPLPINNCQNAIWSNQSMKRKCWLFCMSWISSTLISSGNSSKLRQIIKASSIFWSNDLPPRSNKNMSLSSLYMIMRSFTRKEKKMWFLPLFHENMKMKGPFSPALSLYQIGSKFFAKNGYKILKFCI